MTETWVEVRCVACVPLGFYSSHLLLRVEGAMSANGVKLQMKCPRCKSLIQWDFGEPKFAVLTEGVRNHRRQTAAFE